MASKKLRIGIIGMGDAVLDYFYPALKDFEKNGFVELKALADIGRMDECTGELKEKIAQDKLQYFQVDNQSCKLPDEFFEGVDAVYIATPNDTHKAYTLQCIEKGKHVLCEKPLASGIADVSEMARVAALNPKLVCMDAAHYVYKDPCLALYDNDSLVKEMMQNFKSDG
ncbi:MAG: Gfo/Idh/MocA family oxidoreductase, partial [Candidatus Aenigmatarchaeota archaeon]